MSGLYSSRNEGRLGTSPASLLKAGCACVFACALASAAQAQSATRDLPDSFLPGQAFGVSISLVVPPGTTGVGVEDRPPDDWVVSDISNSGSFDAPSMKVKWGPFFAPSIPTTLSYTLTPPPTAAGEQCFVGTASFDGLDQTIAGDACVAREIPAVTTWGMLVLGLLTASAATVVITESRRKRGLYE
jgi:hypothetical protein